MKKIAITAIVTMFLTAGFSVFAMGKAIDNSTGKFIDIPVATTPVQEIVGDKILSDAEQIAMGNKYNIYTGKLLEVPIHVRTVEERLTDIEARLSALENK